MKNKYLIIYGFGYSGSGAVLDLLKEIDGVTINKSFFSLIKDPYGIINLEDCLVNNWDFVRADTALKDFEWLCKKSSGSDNNLIVPAGLNLKKTLNPNFLEISKKYLNKITTFDYYCWNEIDDFKLPYVKNVFKRILRILKRIIFHKESVDNKMLFSSISKDAFYDATRQYIDDLFSANDKNSLIVLDHHPLPIQFGDKLNLYFGPGAKMIVVDRDPRDIYCDLVDHQNRIGRELAVTNDVHKYCLWHNALRSKLPNSENILYLKFEDLIDNYDFEVHKILAFLGIDDSRHVRKKDFFNPDVSIRNVGIWKNNSSIPRGVFEEIANKIKY